MTEEERREGFALFYLAALDAGDADGVARCLAVACEDETLDAIVSRIDEAVYEEDFGTGIADHDPGRPVARFGPEGPDGAPFVRVLFVHEGGGEGER